MLSTNAQNIHANALQWLGKGLLLLAESGCGKSDLSLRLIDAGAVLVADDQIFPHNKDGKLFVHCPPNLQGLLEVRGIGIMPVQSVQTSEIHVVFCLTQDKIERLPAEKTITIAGVPLPVYDIHPFHVSSVSKIKIVLQSV